MNDTYLRTAAHLLIAHYLLFVGLALFNKGGLDYVNLLVMLVVVIGATRALYRPKGKGWLLVVAYALYALGPMISIPASALHLWGLTSIGLGTKIGATVIWSVLILLVVVALVFVYIGRAALRAPAPTDSVGDTPAPKE